MKGIPVAGIVSPAQDRAVGEEAARVVHRRRDLKHGKSVGHVGVEGLRVSPTDDRLVWLDSAGGPVSTNQRLKDCSVGHAELVPVIQSPTDSFSRASQVGASVVPSCGHLGVVSWDDICPLATS